MRDDQHRFLVLLGQLPARLTVDQAAWVLNCQSHDVPILIMARLLKPPGNPAPNGVRYFGTMDVLELAKDRAWLGKMTSAVSQRWKQKNLHKKGHSQVGAVNGQSAETGVRVRAAERSKQKRF